MGVRSRLFLPICLVALICPLVALAEDGTDYPSEIHAHATSGKIGSSGSICL